MKHFWMLFSLFLIALTVLPCSDSIECKDTSKITVSENSNHEKHNHESEQCSPFCTCACCGITIYKFQTASISFKENLDFYVQKKELSHYSFNYNKKIILKIWQPPKIS
ncbi:MAG: DUF6660 family protein [Flavobacterium sp.]